MTSRRTFVLRGVLDVCFLAAIDDHPDYGHALAARLDGYGLEVAEGSIYSALHRLVRAGLIEVDAGPDESRKRYSLTPAGRASLQQGRREWAGVSTAIDACLSANGAADGSPITTAR